jgi:DNA-binding protein HU-beta
MFHFPMCRVSSISFCSTAMDAFISTITETLKAEGKLAIPSLGTFELRERAARTGKNPRTGEKVEISAKKVPAFKAAKALKDAVE